MLPSRLVWRSEGSLQEFLFSYHVDSWDATQGWVEQAKGSTAWWPWGLVADHPVVQTQSLLSLYNTPLFPSQPMTASF